MPTHRSVTISLRSQYDAVAIPETLSPASKNLLPISSRTITAHIPVLPSSQFWICYRCPLPPPPKPGGDETRFYYFKLYVAGTCVLSWGVSEQDEWSGKTIFGLFDAGTDFEGRKIIEKRGLFFPRNVASDAGFEIRVLRAKARRREEAKYEAFKDFGFDDAGLNFTTTGRKKKGERQRRYTYALIDPVDTPYVTFRYLFRTTEQLRELESQDCGIDDPDESVISLRNEYTSCPDDLQSFVSLRSDRNHSASSLEVRKPDTRPTLRRLSIPPRKPLTPGTTQMEPSSPSTKETVPGTESKSTLFDLSPTSTLESSISTRCYGWQVRTPSSVEVAGDHPAPPATPPSKRKMASSGLLRSVVASAMKRKENKNVKK